MRSFDRPRFPICLFIALTLALSAAPGCREAEETPAPARSEEPVEAPTAGPRVTFDPPVMSFGEIESGEPAGPRRLTLTARTGELEIVEVVLPGSAPFTCRRVDAGSEPENTAAFEIAFDGSSETGRQAAHIDFVTKDDVQPRLRYLVKADVVGVLRVRPERLQLRMSPGQRVAARVDLLPGDPGVELRIEKTELLAENLPIVVKTIDHPEVPNGRRILLSGVAPKRLAGARLGELRIHTNVEGFERIIVPITGSMRATGPRVDPAPVARRPSSLVFEEAHHDFGRIREENGVVRHVFRFKNAGTRPVTIEKVDSSCSCLVSQPEKKTYAPGETGTLEVSLDPALRQGPTGRKSVTIVSDDRLNPIASVTVSAEIFPRIGIDPVTLFFGELPVGEAAPEPRVVTITSSVPGFEIRNVVLPDGSPFAWKPLGATKGEMAGEDVVHHRFEVTFRGLDRIERLRMFATLETNDAVRPKVSYPLVASVIGPLRVKPDRIFFRAKPGEPFEQIVTVVARRASQAWEIRDCLVEGPEAMRLSVTREPIDGGYRIRLEGITPRAARRGAAPSAKITIETDVAQQKLIEVPVRVLPTSEAPR